MKTKQLLMLWALALWLVPSLHAQSSDSDSKKESEKESESKKAKTVNYCTGFVTYTQEVWNENSESDKCGNSNKLLTNNFSTVFPNGLTVGCNAGYKIIITTREHIKSFLPAEGNENSLDKSCTNPKNTRAGKLAGELIALTLNVAYDDAIPSFSAPENHIGDMTIQLVSSPFYGLTVRQFLAVANNVLGGCSSTYTASQVCNMAKKINENFKKGKENDEENDKQNKGLLNCTPPLWTSVTGVNNTCSYSSNASATLAITSGVPPYTVLWSNSATTNTITGLTAGTYTVTIKDGANQTATKSVTITTPSVIAIGLTATDVKCFGASTGSIAANVSGGTGAYSYSWSNTATTSTISNIAAGNYELTVTDANACIAKANKSISQPVAALNVTGTATAVTCNGLNNGSIDMAVTGGTGAYSYLWNDNATTEDRSALTPGSYTVTVTDANACTATGSTQTITEPAILNASTSQTNVLCKDGNNGAIDLTVTGGNGSNTFNWSNTATSEDISDLVAGKYSVIVTDAKACTTSVEATITEPTKLVITGNATNVKCHGESNGAIAIDITGGVSNYTYSWTGATSASTEDLSNLAAGDYTLVVTDANACTATETFTVTEPNVLATNADIFNVKCYGDATGKIEFAPFGGTYPYQYSYANSDYKGNRLENLYAGTYSVTITDANGCTLTAPRTITQPAAALAVTPTVTNVACNAGSNGSIVLSVTGGTGDMTYAWRSNASTSNTISGLSASTYNYTVTDENGCVKSADVVVSQPSVLAVTISSNLLCYTGSNGAITANVSGGSTPYASYAWTKTGSAITASTATWAGRNAGTYSVVVTDANSCTATKSITINPPSSNTCGIFKTYERETWSEKRGSYITANFATVFPNGIVIGAGSNKYTFTTATAVRNFLGNDDDDDSHCSSISGHTINPGSSNNRLAIELLVMKLNVGFDNYFPAFSPSTTKLGDLVIYENGSNAHFNGLSLNEFITLANNALGGVPCGSGYTLAHVKNTAKNLDNNFHHESGESEDDDEHCDNDHNENHGNLVCPCIQNKTGEDPNGPVAKKGTISNSTMTCYPNPFSNKLAVSFTSKFNAQAVVELYNAEGVRVAVLFNGNVNENGTYDVNVNTENLSAGAYFCRFASENETLVQKLIMIK